MSLMGCDTSPFKNFVSYLRIVVGLDEEDIQENLKKYKSKFVSYELTPGICTIQDLLDAVQTFAGHQETLQIEYDDISIKKN